MTSCTLRTLATTLALAAGLIAAATETENHTLPVLPAPGKIVVDGNTDDWDLSGGIFVCGEVEHLRGQYSLWFHAMHDTENIYLLARWKDPTPLNNPEGFGGHGFNGDCLQVRFDTGRGTPGRAVTWWDFWRDRAGTAIAQRASPGRSSSLPENAITQPLPRAAEEGARQAFRVDADGKGYAQEIAIPWKLLNASGKAPQTGESFALTLEPNFTAGAFGRISIKDIFNADVSKPDRIFTCNAFEHWGTATLMAKGAIAPPAVRLADGRTFRVTMADGRPVVDWTGLIRKFEWPGFKPITFKMPFDGYVSLNIIGPDGVVARHLLNWDQRAKGAHTVQWDGLGDAVYRTPGEPLPSGDYSWQAIAHPGAKLTFRGYASSAARVPWNAGPTDFWLGDHGVPTAVVTDGRRMVLATNGAEGGRHLIATDFDGKLLWSLQNTTGGTDPEVIAVDGASVYVVHPAKSYIAHYSGKSTVLITKVDAKTGIYQPWVGEKGRNHILKTVEVFGENGPTQLNGLDARDGTLYGTTDNGLVLLDAATGALRQSWPLPGAGAIKLSDDNTAYVIRGADVLIVNPANGTSKPFVTGLSNPRSLTLDKQGRVLVSLGEPAHQVVIYDAHGKEVARVGEPGGRDLGPWQSRRMYQPAGIAVDPLGKLWVMERDAHPKRVSVWNLADGALVTEFFGPTHCGNSGAAINPRDPNLMVGVGCEWRLDPKSGRSACVGTFDRSYHSFATFREGANGRLYLYTFKGQYGVGALQVWERRGDAEFVKRTELRTIGDLAKSAGQSELWVDANGDGQEQPEEILRRDGALLCSGSNGWSLNLGPDLTLYAQDWQDKRLKALPSTGFSACGAPKYDIGGLRPMPEAMSTGYVRNYSCALPSADNKTILVNLAVKDHPAGYLWHGFDLASGKRLWTYPNPYFQVHGSHKAPAPEPGLFRGAYGPIGAVSAKGARDFWVINCNLGEWNAITADGFFLTRLFNGNPLEWQWPAEAIPGADMTDTPPGSGGEDFGGSVTQAKDGRIFLQSGKYGIWNVLLTGLDQTIRLPGGKLTLSGAETKQAQTLRDNALQAAAAGGKLTVKYGTIAFSGSLDADFKGCELAQFQKMEDARVRAALAYDDTTLYLGWEVRDGTPWVNGATDISQMYACGDTVDFQLGADPKSDPGRGAAVKGDLRLSIGNYQGKPTAVLYKFVSDEKKPRIFTSGVIQNYQVDWVDVLAEAVLKVKVDKDRYVVEAAVPLATLGLKPTPGLTLRGDLGVTHADLSGVRTRLRSYWANQQTGLVDDVVFELQLTPKNWGEISFK
jgi:hypothetical protein